VQYKNIILLLILCIFVKKTMKHIILIIFTILLLASCAVHKEKCPGVGSNSQKTTNS
jgi:PBP1b-binding outer membrane lipoprotein LpoB